MKETSTHLQNKFTSTAPPAESARPPKSNGYNVLVVDDENGICQIVQRMLSDKQYQVQTSQSVADAFRAIEQKPFDAYVMDDKLPDRSKPSKIRQHFKAQKRSAYPFFVKCEIKFGIT